MNLKRKVMIIISPDNSDDGGFFEKEPMLFGKWSYTEGDALNTTDLVFNDHIAFKTPKARVFLPHTAGKYQVKRFRKVQCPIVERLASNSS